jgi:hypothetical protein
MLEFSAVSLFGVVCATVRPELAPSPGWRDIRVRHRRHRARRGAHPRRAACVHRAQALIAKRRAVALRSRPERPHHVDEGAVVLAPTAGEAEP